MAPLATLTPSAGHANGGRRTRVRDAAAVAALDRVLDSSAVVIHPDERDFHTTREQFTRYGGQDISFTDHVSGVLASERDVEHVFTFDSDHFRTLGFTVVPDDTGEA